jgi:hypothetical protein
MDQSLRALLTGIIDFAGLFPPARLPLAEALEEYAREAAGPGAFMLGRFVCPVTQLGRILEKPVVMPPARQPVAVAALSDGGGDEEGLLSRLAEDLERVATFTGAARGAFGVEQLEVPLPAAIVNQTGTLERTVGRACELLHGRDLMLFFELPLVAPEIDGAAAIPAIAAGVGGAPAGIKIRLGGLDAAAIPETTQVAAVIAACRTSSLLIKATQGLHHPVRRLDEHSAFVHGFLNLFAAAILGSVHDLSPEQIQDILEDDDPASFRFEGERFAWLHLAAGTDVITESRRTVISSFGSCSFAEPRDGLRELGLLPPDDRETR